MKRQSTYRRIIIGLLIVLLFSFGAISLLPHESVGALKEVSRSIAEAALISLVVALAVEPTLRARFYEETRDDLLWGLYNPDAPEEYRETLHHLARTKHFRRDVRWTIFFEWEDVQHKVLKIDLQVRSDGITYDKDGYIPRTRRWVNSSCGDYDSDILEWSLFVPAVAEWSDKNSFVGAQAAPFITPEQDGSRVLDEEAISGSRRIPARTPYVTLFRSRHYQGSLGETELITRLPTLETVVSFEGGALADIDVWIRHMRIRPGFTEGLPLEWQRWEGEPIRFGLSLPGQMMMVSWREKRSGEVTQSLKSIS